MSVNLDEIGQEAVRLCEEADSEIKYRNAISRMYYNLFHATLAFAENEFTPPPSTFRGSTHAKLAGMLSQSFEKDLPRRIKLRKLGVSLTVLHQTRCDADYQLDKTLTSADMDSHRRSCLARIQDIQNLSIAPAA